MTLTGSALAVSMILALIGLTAATLALWNRMGRLGPARWAARALLLGTGQLAAVLVTALLINDQFVFYQSWSELFGGQPKQGQQSASPGQLDARLHTELLAHFHAGLGTVLSLPVPGLASGVRTGPAAVYLPPQYGDPAYADRQFPVVELLSGFPGGPASWVHNLQLSAVLTSLINTGRSAPFIAVVPVQNVALPRDTECVNVVRGPQVDSYLSFDVRTAIERSFRASPSGDQWAVMGYSTGGYCAEDLSLRHPGMFSAAVSMAGYNAPAHDPTTGHLFGSQPSLANYFSPTWLLQHRHFSPLHLLLMTTRADRLSMAEASQLAALNRPPLQLSILRLPRGGHNFGTFAAELPIAFSYLSRYVGQPLAPPPALDGQVPHTVPYPGQGCSRSCGSTRTVLGGHTHPRSGHVRSAIGLHNRGRTHQA